MAWFNLKPSGDPSVPADYTLATTPPSCGSTEEKICAINATNNGSGQPILDAPLLLQMVRALQFEANEADVQLKAR
ncbi:hypothetical protein [Sphingobacterium paucimobilis]|uniref:Uncharacterized protein n=1 Tax=Sphingobacterium paucimobilis HER1398 TaxID=1346330 RepID=U2J8G5_9SPHI|nr:hypothetical protein [Sphingobacterium paucimobilis]ERJ61224.1 hypothetical protein M472_20950 [Sphingobacterium paucimobilis HER1398]